MKRSRTSKKAKASPKSHAKRAPKSKAKVSAKPSSRRLPTASKSARSSKPSAPPSKRTTPSSPAAARVAAFSSKMLKEEEVPVAVRSWSEAKAGQRGSQELIPQTGKVVDRDSKDEEEEEMDVPPRAVPAESSDASDEPRLNPLTGPVAVPKPKPDELEFDLKAQRTKRPRIENPDQFGPVELRQATATGGRHITRAKPENLQKGAGRIQALTTPPSEASGSTKKRSSKQQFEVAQGTTQNPGLFSQDLGEFGEVEIGQQTLRGSRKVGTLETPKKKKDSKEKDA